MDREFLYGVFFGIAVCLFVIKIREMKSDIAWCKTYVDRHLEAEHQESLKK